MKLTIRNKTDRTPVGIRPASGVRELAPGAEFTGEFSEGEAKNLRSNSLVRVSEASDDAPQDETLRDDGPTIAEFVDAGYPASNYPPKGFSSRSTPEEIEAAIAAETGGDDGGEADDKPRRGRKSK